jgi:DNA-binding CsgD family transcriptional regulator
VGGNQSPKKSFIESLSNRELEVFRLIGEGLSTGQLAERLHISRHTIDTHRQRIKEKLNLASATELSRAAMQWVLQGE